MQFEGFGKVSFCFETVCTKSNSIRVACEYLSLNSTVVVILDDF